MHCSETGSGYTYAPIVEEMLAEAMAIEDPELAVIVYDERLPEAARAARLTVVQPGMA